MQLIQILILAAGKGKRMKSDLPKALLPFCGKPMIVSLLDAAQKSGVCDKLAIVVGHKANIIQQILGTDFLYVYQDRQLGTGHAVRCAQKQLQGMSEHVLVLYADHPFLKAGTIRKIVAFHTSRNTVMSIATATVSDFEGWRKPLSLFGRVVRGHDGKIQKVVEINDATEEELKIMEVNPAFFCFHSDWLWDNIHRLENTNAQKEYYLTDLVPLALQDQDEIPSVSVDPLEAIGINTPEQLKALESFTLTTSPKRDYEIHR